MSACVARNIIAGFQSTDIFPYNSEIFGDDDFSPSAVSDRDPARISQMVTSSQNSEQSAETQTTQSVSVSVAVATEKDMPGTSTASNEFNDHETTLNSTYLTACSSKTSHYTIDVSRHSGTFSAYVSPNDILPFQKAGPRRRITLNRRKGSTRILTDTPVKDELQLQVVPGQRKKQSLIVFLQREICLKSQESWSTTTHPQVAMNL